MENGNPMAGENQLVIKAKLGEGIGNE